MQGLKEESIPSLYDGDAQEIPIIEVTPDTDDNVIEPADEEQNEGNLFILFPSSHIQVSFILVL